jgi:hypothetical protein
MARDERQSMCTYPELLKAAVQVQRQRLGVSQVGPVPLVPVPACTGKKINDKTHILLIIINTGFSPCAI